MSERFYWENGERVPVADPEVYEDDKPYESPSAVTVRILMGILLKSPHPSLSLKCLALISSVGYDGASMAQIAREENTTRSAVSRRCVDYCKLLGLKPVRAMRNESAQENCRKARINNMKKLISETKYLCKL